MTEVVKSLLELRTELCKEFGSEFASEDLVSVKKVTLTNWIMKVQLALISLGEFN